MVRISLSQFMVYLRDLSEPFPSRQMLQETIDQILPGTDCVEADQGWWQFEICYGKTVFFPSKISKKTL